MQDRKVTLLIEEDGSVKIDVDGVKGKACTLLTADVEKALGVVKNRTEKAEYRQLNAQNTTQQQLRSGDGN